jgi:hypothetical protein
MDEAKRRAQADASITAKHRRMASRIDTRMKQLDAAALDEVEIIAAMADYMSDFHHLITDMTSPAMNTLCREFAGLHRYARIVEAIASGIAAGKIKVPGGRAVSDEQKTAAAIDQRVRQLEATGIDDAALLEHMVGHLFDLHRLWNTASDESLALLCREYPGLYRYGLLVETAFEAQRKTAHTAASHPPELPDAIKVSRCAATKTVGMRKRSLAVMWARAER